MIERSVSISSGENARSLSAAPGYYQSPFEPAPYVPVHQHAWYEQHPQEDSAEKRPADRGRINRESRAYEVRTGAGAYEVDDFDDMGEPADSSPRRSLEKPRRRRRRWRGLQCSPRAGSNTRWTVVYAYRNPGLPSRARWLSEAFEERGVPGAEGLLSLY